MREFAAAIAEKSKVDPPAARGAGGNAAQSSGTRSDEVSWRPNNKSRFKAVAAASSILWAVT